MIDDINLGQVSSIHIGSTPPSNTKLIWYDTNVNAHKVYVVSLSLWVLAAPSAGNGFRLFANPVTNATNIVISQATHGVVEVSNVQVMKYLIPPDDYNESIDYVSEGIIVKIKPTQEVTVQNPNNLRLSIKISGKA